MHRSPRPDARATRRRAPCAAPQDVGLQGLTPAPLVPGSPWGRVGQPPLWSGASAGSQQQYEQRAPPRRGSDAIGAQYGDPYNAPVSRGQQQRREGDTAARLRDRGNGTPPLGRPPLASSSQLSGSGGLDGLRDSRNGSLARQRNAGRSTSPPPQRTPERDKYSYAADNRGRSGW